MRIRYLSLTNFRNYARLELTLPERPMLLHGGNAQGKTSLLEAIYLLATGSSPLAASDRELIRWQAEGEGLPYARVWGEVERRDRRLELDITMEKLTLSNGTSRLQKTIRVDRAQKRQSDLSGKLNVVLFTPQNVDLVAGSPSGRRRYMNDALCQVEEAYSEALERYTKALRQRNAALRHVRDERGAPSQLAPFEAALARNGVIIAARRRAFLNHLSGSVKRIHERLTGGEEWLRLEYVPNFDPIAPPALRYQMGMDLQGNRQPPADVGFADLAEAYRQVLVERRSREIARGVTIFGPHRDEIHFIAGSPALGTHEVNLGTYGSRGQQRTAVLSLKLAELGWMREQTGQTPVLLLDEVLAELDRTRRAYLLEQVNGVEQAILTATDPEMFSTEFLKQATVWEVEAGIVQTG
ncbi:MAG: DNA replication/repair protein RecF [Chloroflexota bacterium]|nr:DNA replication/repair protein RecF [Chloroflexota bacterium]